LGIIFLVLVGMVGVPIGALSENAARVVSIVFNVAIIVIAVGALSARAFQQGLQPKREIERYQQYQSAVRAAMKQFDEADTPTQKIMVMRQIERLHSKKCDTFC
jgi:hypothetical protein